MDGNTQDGKRTEKVKASEQGSLHIENVFAWRFGHSCHSQSFSWAKVKPPIILKQFPLVLSSLCVVFIFILLSCNFISQQRLLTCETQKKHESILKKKLNQFQKIN